MSVFESGDLEYQELAQLGEYTTGEFESDEFESDEFESDEFESDEFEQDQFLGGLLGSVLGGELESPLNEMQEAELATELLEISSEEELDQFLGKLFRGVAKGVGGFMKSSTGRALGGVLKNVARKALPVAAGALGNLVVPGVGGVIGSKLGSAASKLFELELESMDEQEAEFEVARRFVRLAGTAAKNAALAPRSAPPRAVARVAVVTAARKHAPGLVRGTPYARRRPGAPAARRPVRRDASGRFTPTRPRRPRPRGAGAGAAAAAPSFGAPSYAGPTYAIGPTYAAGPSFVSGGGDPYAEPLDDPYAEPGGGAVSAGPGGPGGGASGRWVRRGRKIIIYGV